MPPLLCQCLQLHGDSSNFNILPVGGEHSCYGQ